MNGTFPPGRAVLLRIRCASDTGAFHGEKDREDIYTLDYVLYLKGYSYKNSPAPVLLICNIMLFKPYHASLSRSSRSSGIA